MSKIISAINSMISNQDKISQVSIRDGKYYFLYKNIYIWSIQLLNDDYILNYYTGEITIEELINEPNIMIMDVDYNISCNYDYISYSANAFKVKEAIESFKNLYLIVQEKLYNIDKVLDDIIDEDFL